MYIYIYSSDQVSAMHPPTTPPPPNYFAEEKIKKRKKEKKKEGKEMCNLFCACLYFKEDILNQNC